MDDPPVSNAVMFEEPWQSVNETGALGTTNGEVVVGSEPGVSRLFLQRNRGPE
jgi:hypothetical protein